jgi:hypothetical protein
MQVQSLEQCEHFACLTFAGIQLLIPQIEVYSLEPTVDMTPVMTDNSVGQLEQGRALWTMYALSSDLQLLSHCPDNYHIAVLMKHQPLFGLVCEQIVSISRKELSIHALPTAMRNPNSPLLALALIDEQVRYISSAAVLGRLFAQGASS